MIGTTKMTVSNGDFANEKQKIMVMKRMIAALIHKGFNISSAADALSITRQTIHNYMNEDHEFKNLIESGLLEDVQQKAMMRLTQKALMDDSETAQKYLLDKSGYWENRRDVNRKDIQSDNIIEIVTPADVKSIADSIIGDFDFDLDDPTEDKLQAALRATDKSLHGKETETTEEATV